MTSIDPPWGTGQLALPLDRVPCAGSAGVPEVAPCDTGRATVQLSLPLDRPDDALVDSFLVSDSNAAAAHHLERWDTWPVRAALLVGPRKSGRSLLARMFVDRTGGVMADDVERLSETELFHAWNRAQAERRPLLMVADAPPPIWGIRLPDLRSRIAATPVLRIEQPDDALVPLLIQHWFDRRELLAGSGLVPWLARRVERSHLSLLRVVELLEEDAMIRSNPRISIQSARAALAHSPLVIPEAA